jgi:uncharacterized protein YdbL (DUF1318 family)
VRKLARKRTLAAEEVAGFAARRDAELRRLAKQIAAERCDSAKECAASAVTALQAAVAGVGAAPPAPGV